MTALQPRAAGPSRAAATDTAAPVTPRAAGPRAAAVPATPRAAGPRAAAVPATPRAAGPRAAAVAVTPRAAGPRAAAASVTPRAAGPLGAAPARVAPPAPARVMEPYAVSNHRFAAFADATGYVTEAERDGWSFVFAGRLPDDFPPTRALAGAPWWRAVPGASWRSPDGPGSLAAPDHPVVHVSHADALAFCAWAGVALPTDAEWERAARAGVTTRYPWGDEWSFERANSFRGASFPHGVAGTVPVDAFEPNPLGLHNVVGNVWEWTAEGMLRGGSYLCHPSYCDRNQLSGRSEGDAPMGHIGFRVI